MGDRSRPEGDLVRVLVDIAVACGILVVPIAALDVALTRWARRSRLRAELAEHAVEARETAEERVTLTHR
jgi:flagellar biosynthesis protein FlhB